MLGCQDILEHYMSQLPRTYSDHLNQEEWDELVALKRAIDDDITQVHPDRLEKFTEYLVRSLRQRGG
jgi:hypothetical protein